MITPPTVSGTKRSGHLGNTAEFLTLGQARKLVLLSQGLPPKKERGRAIDSTLRAIERLGYVQIDTISAVERAHHHTLWNRNLSYKNNHVEKLSADRKIFEYWSHAASYLPMKDYRFTLPRKHAIAQGNQNHWYRKDKPLMTHVLARITAEGPLMAKDFAYEGEKIREWESKPSKRALENLFMQGELMISGRVNFHKVYDLTERVLPGEVNTFLPTKEEYTRFLITRFLEANGIGQASEIGYLKRGIKPLINSTLNEMKENGELVEVVTEGIIYFALPSSLSLLGKPLSRARLKILSPFDNLLIQRKRMRTIFDFDYLLECYVPNEKRIYGYFSLPLLWNGKLMGRMDCRAERRKSCLHINNLVIEPGTVKSEQFVEALALELIQFMKFNNCRLLEVHRTAKSHSLKPDLEKMIDDKLCGQPQ